MLLGKDGHEGLDLSFVTDIIFLDVVMDKAVETQTVARAWRMGAKGPVNVETLIAENSIEESMFNLEQGEGSISSTGFQYLLKNLRLIANTSTLGFGSVNKPKALDLKRRGSVISNPMKQKNSKRRCVQFQVPS